MTSTVYPTHVIDLSFGKGLAATHDLDTGVVVEKFVGEIKSYTDVPAEEKIYALWVDYPDKYLIPQPNARYANHSCDPNSTINKNKEIVTLRPIKAGEQITFVYNVAEEDGYWDPLWTFQCFCGSANCMKTVSCYVDKNHKPFNSEKK